jgi:hypothetical protein
VLSETAGEKVSCVISIKLPSLQIFEYAWNEYVPNVLIVMLVPVIPNGTPSLYRSQVRPRFRPDDGLAMSVIAPVVHVSSSAVPVILTVNWLQSIGVGIPVIVNGQERLLHHPRCDSSNDQLNVPVWL